MWALVPLKLLAQAKQRLAARLSPEQRRELVLAMAADVLGALQASQRIEHLLIISRNVEAQALARTFAAEVFAESEQADLPRALIEGIAHASARGARGVCIVPADAPLLTSTDVDFLIASHRACTLVPDSELVGTNALVLTPPALLTPIFDGRSFKPHLRAAIAGAVTVRIVTTTGFALDIDTPEDLQHLLDSPGCTHAKTYLQTLQPAIQEPSE